MRLTINAIFYINRTDRVGDRQTPRRHERLSHVSPTLGGEADIRLAQFSSPAKQGLRVPAGDERSIHSHRNDPSDARSTTLMPLLNHALKAFSDALIGGISMGGDVAIATSEIDRRVQCAAAMLATPDWLRTGMKDFANPSIEFAQGEAATYAKSFYDKFNPLTHLESISHLPEITFECGAQDALVPPDGALRFQKALNSYVRPGCEPAENELA